MGGRIKSGHGAFQIALTECLRAASDAFQAHRGYGFTEEFLVSCFYCGTLGGGTTETLKHLIGRHVIAGADPVDRITGLGRF